MTGDLIPQNYGKVVTKNSFRVVTIQSISIGGVKKLNCYFGTINYKNESTLVELNVYILASQLQGGCALQLKELKKKKKSILFMRSH